MTSFGSRRILPLLLVAGLSLGASAAGAAADPYVPYDFHALAQKLGRHAFGTVDRTHAEELALEDYTSKEYGSYREINDFLRRGAKTYLWYGTGPARAREIVDLIDRLFSRAPTLPKNLILYRGLGDWDAVPASENEPAVDTASKPGPVAIGREKSDPAYLSTSTSRDVAVSFARSNLFVLYFGGAPTRAILIDKKDHEVREDEVILPHGQRLRIMARARARADRPYAEYLVQICGSPGGDVGGPRCRNEIPSGVLDAWKSEVEK